MKTTLHYSIIAIQRGKISTFNQAKSHILLFSQTIHLYPISSLGCSYDLSKVRQVEKLMLASVSHSFSVCDLINKDS